MVNASGPAVVIQRHYGSVRNVRIFADTIVARDNGISVTGGQSGTTQRVAGNAVFAATRSASAGLMPLRLTMSRVAAPQLRPISTILAPHWASLIFIRELANCRPLRSTRAG